MHSLGGSGCSLLQYLSLITWLHVIWSGSTAESCGGTEEDLKSADVEGFTSRALALRKRKSEPLLPPPPRNETRSTLEWSTQPTQSEHHRSHWIATSKRSLEGVCTSCTNQAHYSQVCMCTPCSKPHPPPNWRSRSRVDVSYLTSCLNWFRHWWCAHTWSTYTYVGVPCAPCAISPSFSVTDPSMTQSYFPNDTFFAASHMLCTIFLVFLTFHCKVVH